jgi:hypothetical protein
MQSATIPKIVIYGQRALTVNQKRGDRKPRFSAALIKMMAVGMKKIHAFSPRFFVLFMLFIKKNLTIFFLYSIIPKKRERFLGV